MVKVLGIFGAFVASTIAWWLTARFGFVLAFFASTVGAAIGGYYGAKYARERLS
ncbi:MAG TPA: hypothetical protein VE967_15290 [Gemmatimonadaceae bacterium]|nr:hypothetical protein [Gemmatimonadaceae bacterium]